MICHCAIVDDKTNDIQIMQNTISSICYGTDLLIEFHCFNYPSDTEILKLYDLYILDIDMPDINGFDLASRIYAINSRAVIIFCTMHDNLVFDSLHLNAFYFVRKDHLQDDFIYAFKKYLSFNHNDEIYVAKTSDGLKKICIRNIMYFEVAHNDVYIHLSDNNEIKERKSLQRIKEEFKTKGFIPIGKSFVVNMHHISSVSKYYVLLSNNQRIPIPKTQYASTCKAFLMYSSR